MISETAKAKKFLKEWKKIGSRPSLVIDQKFIEHVEKLAFAGMKARFVYSYFDLNAAEWNLYCRAYPEISKAYERGRAKGVAYAESKMMDKIRVGDNDLIKFYLKARGEYNETSTLKVEDNIDKTQVSLKLTVTDPVEASRVYQKIMGD